jgi:hypothetical protein
VSSLDVARLLVAALRSLDPHCRRQAAARRAHIDLMHARDQARGGACVSRLLELVVPAQRDIFDAGIHRASCRRFEYLDTMLGSAEVALDIDEPAPLDLD